MKLSGTNNKTASDHQIRLLEDGDFEQAENIWSQSFDNWPRNYLRFDINRVYGAFKEKRLDAVVGVVDFEMRLGERMVSCGGIAAVATAPQARYQGLSYALLVECLRELNERRVALSCLWPFQQHFYQRMGWAATHNDYVIDVDFEYLKPVSRAGNAKNWRMVALDECDQILPIHERWIKNWNLSLRRPQAKYQRMILQEGLSWQIYLHADGYLLCNMSESKDRILSVQEFAYVNDAAFLDGLALLAQMDEEYDRVQWTDGDVERLFKLGIPHPHGKIELKPGIMTRVVNLESFRAALPQPLARLHVRDPLGVTAAVDGDGIGPGELVQLVAGYWQTPDPRFPSSLHAIAGQQKSFCREKF